MSHTGSCHCGAISYRVEGEIDQVLDCNCSMCRRRGGLLWFVPRDALTLTGEVKTDTVYTFHRHAINHHFCARCGIAPWSEGSMPDGSPIACINVRCLDGVDLAALKVVPFDGASR